MKDFLKTYIKCDSFDFSVGDDLSTQCNAPKNAGGIYVLIDTKTNSIIYIGCSGWVTQIGKFEIRKNGIYDRIVNGKQFDQARKKSWSIKMKEQGIDRIKIEWYDTFNEEIKNIPAYVEACCLQLFFDKYKKLPLWNTDF
jgi:hypothetical protein